MVVLREQLNAWLDEMLGELKGWKTREGADDLRTEDPRIEDAACRLSANPAETGARGQPAGERQPHPPSAQE